MSEVRNKNFSGEGPDLVHDKISEYPKGIGHLDISDLKDLGFEESRKNEGLFYKQFTRDFESIEIEAVIFVDFRDDDKGIYGINKDGKGETESIPRDSLRGTGPYQELLKRVDQDFRNSQETLDSDSDSSSVSDVGDSLDGWFSGVVPEWASKVAVEYDNGMELKVDIDDFEIMENWVQFELGGNEHFDRRLVTIPRDNIDSVEFVGDSGE